MYIDDEYIIKNFTTKNKHRILHEKIKQLYETPEKFKDEIFYLKNRFSDSKDSTYNEIIFRIVNKIESVPKCISCGSPAKFIGKKRRNSPNGYILYCSRDCFNGRLINDVNNKTKKVFNEFNSNLDIVSDFSKWSDSIKKDKLDGNLLSLEYFEKNQKDALSVYKEKYYNYRLKDIVYCILNDIKYIPKCQNPNCSNSVEIRNYVKGFRKFCSDDCKNLCCLTDDAKKKIRLSIIERSKKNGYITGDVYFNGTYPTVKEENGKKYYIVDDYCKHGTLTMLISSIKEIYNKGTEGNYCEKCNIELFENYNPTEEEISSLIETYPSFYKSHSLAINRFFWIRYYPKKFKILMVIYKRRFNPDFEITYENVCGDDKTYVTIIQEINYSLINNVLIRPKCLCDGCNNETKFFSIINGYSIFCEKHKRENGISLQEKNFHDYILDLGYNPKRNVRNLLHSCELDFYFEDLNRAIEYNGCFYHSTAMREKDYNYSKFEKARKKKISLLSIWEDDYLYSNFAVDFRVKSFLLFDKDIKNKIFSYNKISPKQYMEIADKFLLDKREFYLDYFYGIFDRDKEVLVFSYSLDKAKNLFIDGVCFCGYANDCFNAEIGLDVIKRLIFEVSATSVTISMDIDYLNVDFVDILKNNFDISEEIEESYMWFDNGIRKFRNKSLKGEILDTKCYSGGIIKLNFSIK